MLSVRFCEIESAADAVAAAVEHSTTVKSDCASIGCAWVTEGAVWYFIHGYNAELAFDLSLTTTSISLPNSELQAVAAGYSYRFEVIAQFKL